MKPTSYLIIGSGVAGLTFAIKIATHFPEKNVVIITKSNEDESNTKYAQGGIAIVVDDTEDSYQKHIEDTLRCGAGLCTVEVVKMVVTEGPKRFKELLAWGTQFDKNDEGKFDLGKEGGHSENRVVHHKDQTGHEIERAILEKVHQLQNITVLDHHFALDLLLKDNCCIGAIVLNQKTNSISTIPSEYTLLATGGIGHLYGHTTNPIIATGDGIAMAFRANAIIKDMEFIQFHPTALYATTTSTAFLISEAVRGFGAYLRTKDGKRFMQEYDSRMELASRDIVSQSIDLELQKTGDDCVYLDCSHLNLEEFIKHFPMIYDQCKSLGIDIAKDWIPVLPAQHYLCGGIAVDQNGKTSISNLFACGECSYTGLHGANRLASNSLLEALVYSDKIYNYLANTASENTKMVLPVSKNQPQNKPKISLNYSAKMKTQLQLLIRKNAGIVRNDADLIKAKARLQQWQTEVNEKMQTHQISAELYELYNMIIVGNLILVHSINRTGNCGSFRKK